MNRPHRLGNATHKSDRMFQLLSRGPATRHERRVLDRYLRMKAARLKRLNMELMRQKGSSKRVVNWRSASA